MKTYIFIRKYKTFRLITCKISNYKLSKMITAADIKHGFGYRSHDLNGLFEGNKLSSFMNKLEKQCIIDTDRYKANDYLGHGFEFLINILLVSSPIDNRFGVSNYEPILVNDTGVDGIGFNIYDKKSVIQCKYRANSEAFLTANEDKLSNMFSCAQTTHFISTVNSEVENLKSLKERNLINDKNFKKELKELEEQENIKRHYVFTTAKGLNFYTDNEMYKNEVKCIGYDDLRHLLDNNKSFWKLCRQIALEITNK